MDPTRLPVLLHLCDSLFPTGGYAHSDGLEAATAAGLVTTPADVRAWVEAVLDTTLRHLEGPAVRLAWEDARDGRLDDLADLDDELHALRPSSTARDASRAVGTRLLKTWERLHGHLVVREMLEAREAGWTLPVAFGASCASAAIPCRDTIEAFMYTRAASTVSAAMRLMPLGQLDAHGIVAEAARRIPSAAALALARRAGPGSFTPLLDIMAMRQQYVTTRLFRS